jgi:hypothetical protein
MDVELQNQLSCSRPYRMLSVNLVSVRVQKTPYSNPTAEDMLNASSLYAQLRYFIISYR